MVIIERTICLFVSISVNAVLFSISEKIENKWLSKIILNYLEQLENGYMPFPSCRCEVGFAG